jgi:hypothetical protein
MSAAEIMLLSLLLLSLLLLIITLLYYKYSRKFTRERFAFRVFLLISSLSATLIVVLLSSKTTFAVTLAVLAKVLGVGPVDFEPSFSDKALAVFVLLSLIYLGIKLHQNWQGEISVREYQAKLMGLTPGIVGGAVAAIGDISGRVPLEKYSADAKMAKDGEIAFSPNLNKAWHQWAARIGTYVQMGLLIFKRLPIRILSILAVSYKTHGSGGIEFLAYESERKKDLERRMLRLRAAQQKIDHGLSLSSTAD